MKNVLSKVDLFRNDVERFSIATCKPIKHNWWERSNLDCWMDDTRLLLTENRWH